jgi:hypothetical protein
MRFGTRRRKEFQYDSDSFRSGDCEIGSESGMGKFWTTVLRAILRMLSVTMAW